MERQAPNNPPAGQESRDGGRITQLLDAASSGDPSARDALFETVYRELRIIARAHRRRWNGNETLNTTALIHEAYVKFAAGGANRFENRTHFFATASKAMRQVLVNYAEKVAAAKRGGNAVRVTLSGNMPISGDTVDDLLSVNQALEKLQQSNERQARVFECRVFGGMTNDEVAAALEISTATVKRDWSVASAWLYREMREPAPE